MELWLILYIINRVLASLCPFTSKIGAVVSWITFGAVLVFVVLTFFFAEHWWYGLISVAIYWVVPFLTPRIDPNKVGETGKILSGIGSFINNVLVVFMYLALFKVV